MVLLDGEKEKMRVDFVGVDSLIPYIRNSRTHSDEQVAQIAASIREFGWTNPILIDGSNGIIAGHGRLLAARKLGMAEVPVIQLDGMTDTQKRAYIIADNKLALNAGWDDELLKLELGELDLEGFDLELTGFTAEEIAALNPEEQEKSEAQGKGNLSDRFMIPPFSVLNAREGWWQDRKRAWIALGIKSEVGRGGTASTSARVADDQPATYRTIGGKRQRQAAAPGGSARPACDYSKKQRGDGAGRPINV